MNSINPPEVIENLIEPIQKMKKFLKKNYGYVDIMLCGLHIHEPAEKLNKNMVPCQSHKCNMCCPLGDEFCPKYPCLIKRM